MVSDQWTLRCNDALRVALVVGGRGAKKEWDDSRQGWITNEEPRVELEGLKFCDVDFRYFDFSRCRFNHCIFENCDLRFADFSQAIFRDCNFTGSNIAGASFSSADLHRDEQGILANTNVFEDLRFDHTTNMETNRGQLALRMDPALKDMARAAWARGDWNRKKRRSPIFKIINWSTNFGLSIWRLMIISAVIIAAFAQIFWRFDPESSRYSAFLISARYFLNVSDYYETSNSLLSLIGIAEISLGLIILAILIAIFTKKFTDL